MKLNYLLALIASLCLSSCGQNPNNESHSHDDDGDHGHTHDTQVIARGDTLPIQTIDATDISPKYIQLATNVEIIPDIEEAISSVGVLTHEGVFGPLLFAEKTRSFFIELKPGMFLSEHPHPTESMVYTVKGKWVLCSEGKRQVMEEGSLFHFGSNMPTGWEAPFAEGAFLLIVKTMGEGEGYDNYIAGLKEMSVSLEKERKAGTAFYYNALDNDHAAVQFARKVNPDFDEVLNSIQY